QPKPGETLVVGAAAGGVGQIVGQIGKIKGCRVIGIAGGKAKCDYVVNELGFDACIDYKSQDVGAELDRLAPDGIDINFEQVGGDIMVQVLKRMKLFGRMPLCGMISGYNSTDGAEPPGFWTMMLMRRLTVRGFIVTDFAARFGESGAALAGWMLSGQLKTRQDIRPGLENAAETVKELYTGGNFGKLLIEVQKP
ncbi:NADP-dependent oxidoreductase, partial [Sandarakinorhabdus sp.]|uniref:NADP-dependent oxidoreductase n=1 Tax=Sandarakinorhabdus sp. TaxID=1916663 RepID=UPI00286E6259